MFSSLEKRLLYYPEASERGDWAFGWVRSVGRAEARNFLIFHGNAGNARQRLSLAGVFGEGSYYFYEYPGFGGLVHQTPSKQLILDTAIQALGSLDLTIPLYLIGESLGTGVACELVSLCHPPALQAMILVTPYTTMRSMAHHLLPVIGPLLLTDTYDCIHHLPLGVKVIIVAALNDEIIPLHHASQVAQACEDGVLLYYRGGHNDAYLAASEWVGMARLQLGL